MTDLGELSHDLGMEIIISKDRDAITLRQKTYIPGENFEAIRDAGMQPRFDHYESWCSKHLITFIRRS